MQCKDIPDETFVAAVQQAATILGYSHATRWDVAAVLAGHPERIQAGDVFGRDDHPPERLVLAKARKLIRKGLIDGCACGCRGDFSISPATP